MNKLCTLVLLLMVTQLSASNNSDALAYIDRYKEIAVSEMHAHGIPASIKMAQALLESNFGRSDLAISANNHFGIKCGGAWDGDTYFKKDDDRDRNGKLRPSCFRVFDSAEHSFVEHSLFLKDPRKAYRYGPLFDIEKTDYKSWAWGLKKSGYATNPAYANLLISLIEKYSLYTFDYYENNNVKYVEPSDLIAQAKDVRTHDKISTNSHPTTLKSKQGSPSKKMVISDQILVNDRNAVIIQHDQTIYDIAKQYDLSIDKLTQYNEFFIDEKQYQKEGDFVFLEKKSRKYRGSATYHIVKEGEDLLSIAQKYGIRLSTLERKNKITLSMVPLPGQKVKLKGSSISTSEIPLTYDDVEIMESSAVSEPTLLDEKELKETLPQVKEESEVANETVAAVNNSFDLSKPALVSEKQELSNDQVLHYEIGKGDTLYGISRQFNVSVEDIIKVNGLTSNNLNIGQILKIYR